MTERELLSFIETSNTFGSEQILDFLDYITELSPILNWGENIFDCCGTGGDRSNTFNISTTAAIIAAACNVNICKHGGRSSSSQTGSIDVLEALGLNLNAETNMKKMGLDKYHLAFYASKISGDLLAPIKQTCRKFKQTSFLSLLAPLANPVKLKGQIIGVGKPEWVGTMMALAEEIIKRGLRQKFLLIHSITFDKEFVLDELSSASSSHIYEINNNGHKEYKFDPRDYNLARGSFEDLQGKDAILNASIINKILNNDSQVESCIQTACLNAAALIYLSNNKSNFLDQVYTNTQLALTSIKTGDAKTNWLQLLQSQQ